MISRDRNPTMMTILNILLEEVSNWATIEDA